MVDAVGPAGIHPSAIAGERRQGASPPALSVSVAAYEGEMASRYAAFCERSTFGPHQDPVFVSAWARETGAELLVVEVAAGQTVVLMAALEIVQRGLFRVARLPGGRHANGNFPPTDGSLLGSGGVPAGAIPAALRSARPDVDLLSLERLEPRKQGIENPLLAMATGQSPNVSLAVDLAGGFDAVLARANGKRKLKKHRSQTRKFEAAGGHRLVRPRSPTEVDAMLSAFFTMKAARFRRMGIGDVFAAAEVQAFFRRLYRDSLDLRSPRFVLHGLEVGGALRAVTGCSVLGDRMTCDFSAISENGLGSASPGDFLFFEVIKEACENGLAVFDFSVGDEPYKRLWCDIETWQQDVFVPLSRKGAVMTSLQRRSASLKRALKSSPALWTVAKRLRRGIAGRGPVADE